MRILESRQGRQRQRRRVKREREMRLQKEGTEMCGIAGLKVEEGATLMSWKRPGNMFSPAASQRESDPCQHLPFSPGRGMWDF